MTIHAYRGIIPRYVFILGVTLDNFYTNSKQYGNQVLVRGIKDGKRFIGKDKFRPTLYSLSPKETKFKSLFDEPLAPVRFSDINDARQYVKQYEGVHNFKIFGNTNYQFQWISECYRGKVEYNPDQIDTQTIDIETTVNFGFPDYVNPIEEITLISLKNRVTKAVVTFGCWEYTSSRDNVTYVLCEDEEDLFFKFLSWWEDNYPDIITGWNIDEFDIPYMIERMKRIIGEDQTKRLSPFGVIKSREFEKNGQKKIAFDIFGIASLDYYRLYQKFTYTKRENYKLDFIGEVELGMNKLENPYSNFREWYETDPKSFIDYNIVDTDIVDGLEGKLKLIEVAMSLAYMAKINFDDVFGAVKMWDTIVYNYLLDKGIVVPFKEASFEEDRVIEGAYVKEPKPGIYNKLASFDLASLYPHIMMALNMSPETICDTMVDVNVEQLLSGDYSQLREGYALAPNGSMYDMSKKGFVPELMHYFYNQRKVEKKIMLGLKKELEALRHSLSPEEIRVWENKIATSNAFQMALKIALNSYYGISANKGFRFFDTRVAEGVTMSGQLIIQNAEKAANSMLQKIMGTTKDYTIYEDTDSLYIDLEEFVEKFCAGKTLDQKIDFMRKTCDGKFQDTLNKACDELSRSLNWNTGLIAFKREALASRGLFLAPKMYALLVHDNEGVKYETPDLKIMGIALVRSSTPNCVKEPLRDCVMQILTGDEKSLQRFVKEQETLYRELSPETISFPRGANNLIKYSSKASIYQKGCPAQVRAALLYNNLLETMKLTQYTPIREGDKIKFVYLKEPNTLRENLIGFVGKLPPEFNLTKYVDYDTMWEKSFIAALKKLTDAAGWNYEETNTLESLFE